MINTVMTGIIWKKSLSIVAAAALIVTSYFIIGIIFFSSAMYDDINTRNLEEKVISYSAFTPASVFFDTDALADWVSLLGAGSHRITLINRNGDVIFDTSADTLAMTNHLNRPEFQAALNTGIGNARRRSLTLGTDLIYSAAAIYDSNNEFLGVIRLSILVPGFPLRFLNSALPFLIIGFIIVLGASAGLYAVSRRLSSAVEKELDAKLKKKTYELKTKTEEAEAEDRRREVILNSMFDGVIALDSDLKIILANPRSCLLFGMDKDTSSGESDVRGMSLLSFSRSTELEEAAREVLSTGKPFELTLKRYASGLAGNKLPQHFQVIAAPLIANRNVEATTPTGRTKETQGVAIVLSDISRMVRLEQVRKDFAANVSHELRTPIQVIKGFAENILNSSLDDKNEIRRFAEFIEKNTRAMENLTTDLMTLVSLEDDNSPRPPREEKTIAPLLAEAVSIVETAAQRKNISIKTDCKAEVSANVYESLVIQALANLLDNAVKYSKSDSEIRINVFIENNDLVIEVKDTGIGIPAEHLGRIFERFYRVNRSRSKVEANGEVGGTGLGLSIVRHIAMLHSGYVEVESHAGEGSVFRLKLPV